MKLERSLMRQPQTLPDIQADAAKPWLPVTSKAKNIVKTKLAIIQRLALPWSLKQSAYKQLGHFLNKMQTLYL